jgi:hypothetical protein
MADFTINSLLCHQKSLKQRKQELESLRSGTTSRTRYISSDKSERIDEPLYDIKKVDKKIVLINKALLKIDEEIKRSNAKTTVEMPATIDFDNLMSEIDE